MSVSRLPNGLSTAGPLTTLANYGLPDPTSWHSYFNDFNTYVAGDWVVTETDAASTEALTAGDGGLLLLTVTAADNDLVALQSNVGSFLMEAGKPAVFKARFKVSDATQSDFVIGLQIIDTTPLAVSDGIWFQKDDGDALLDVYMGKSSGAGTTSAAAIATVVDDTFLTVGWYYDGKQTLTYFVNDVALGVLVASSTYLPDANLALSFAIQNGEAVAKTMTLDYILAAKHR